MKRLTTAVLSLLLIVQMVASPFHAIASEQSLSDEIIATNEMEQVTEEIVAPEQPASNEQINEQENKIQEPEINELENETPEPEVNELQKPDVNIEQNQHLSATLTDLKTTVNGVAIEDLARPIVQDATISMDFVFATVLNAPKNGDFFTFTLPSTLVDWDNNFAGSQMAMANAPGFKWETVDNIVTVTLTDVDVVKHSGKAQFAINFVSGFVFEKGNNSLEQELVLPSASGKEQVYKLTFLPKSSDEKMIQKGAVQKTATIEEGNRYFDWVVWINKAGKPLTNATVVDKPSVGHMIAGTILVERYPVDLLGVTGTATETTTYGSMNEISLNGTDAYKLTYRTMVTLSAEQQDNKKEFTNTIALTNEGQEPVEVTSETVTTTYGTSLNKRLKGGNNYRTSWEIDFNYNQLALTKEQATVTDTMTGPQKIDLSTIKVYEVNVGDNGFWKSDANGGKPVTNYTLTPAAGTTNTFTLQFNEGINQAYRIVYDAIYEGDFYTESGQRVINGVTSSSKKLTPLYTTRNQDILRKSRTIDYDKQEITWNVTIKADNKEIKDLTLTDAFTATNRKDGTHKLLGDVQDISINNGTKVATALINDDPTQGFVMTGIDIAKGQTATITYKTSYNVADTGKVDQQGYGNTAKIDWISSEVPYSLTASAEYTPEKTSVNNGRKWGSFNYATQQLSWNVVVNANKRDLTGAVLKDTLGEGHTIVEDTFELYNYARTGDTTGTENELLDPKHYKIVLNDSKTGYILTFNAPFESTLNNQAYIVKYKTVDSDNILGIESSVASNEGATYTNEASFKTKNETIFNLVSDAVKIDSTVANNLLQKSVQGNTSSNRDGVLTWIIDVNKSHSTLSNVKVTDTPTERILLDKNSIKIRSYQTTANGITEGTEWKDPSDFNVDVQLMTDGGFTLDFGTLDRKGYQVQYKTITLASSTEEGALENEAKITFDEQNLLAENQQSETAYKNKFAFSKSLAGFSLTKGKVHFEKIGEDSVTKEQERLQGVTFELYLKGTDILMRDSIISDEDGLFTIENLNYGDYTLKETVAPAGYEIRSFDFTLDEKTDDAEQSIQLVNKKATVTVTKNWVGGEALSRPDITITLYQDGKEFAEKIFSNGETTYTWTNLPVGKDGQDFVYTVDEVNPPMNYDKKVEGFTITNTYSSPKTDFTATKKWVNGPALKPAVQFQLLRDGEAHLDIVTLENDTYMWTGLDKTDNDGHVYTYTVREVSVHEDYVATVSEDGSMITNTYKPKTTEVTGKKIWINGLVVKPTIELQLFQNGKPLGEPVPLNDGEMTHTWTNLDVTDNDGNAHVYTIDEVDTPANYEKSVSEDGFIITNRYVAATKDVTVTKVWIGGPTEKPTIELQLFRNGKAMGSSVRLEEGSTSYTWTNLSTTDLMGKPYNYTVDEVTVPVNYVKMIDGLTITNEYVKPSNPEVTEPKPSNPEVTEPKPSTPEVTEPKPSNPEVTEPKPSNPEVTEPEPSTPEVTEPKPSNPEVTEPKPSTPEVTEPKPSNPEVTEPELSTPEVTEPESSTPEVTEEEQTDFIELDNPPQMSGSSESKHEQTTNNVEILNPKDNVVLSAKKEPAKLPQTNGDTQFELIAFGVLLLMLSTYVFIRRQRKA